MGCLVTAIRRDRCLVPEILRHCHCARGIGQNAVTMLRHLLPGPPGHLARGQPSSWTDHRLGAQRPAGGARYVSPLAARLPKQPIARPATCLLARWPSVRPVQPRPEPACRRSPRRRRSRRSRSPPVAGGSPRPSTVTCVLVVSFMIVIPSSSAPWPTPHPCYERRCPDRHRPGNSVGDLPVGHSPATMILSASVKQRLDRETAVMVSPRRAEIRRTWSVPRFQHQTNAHQHARQCGCLHVQ
jgi:hypothetical protein